MEEHKNDKKERTNERTTGGPSKCEKFISQRLSRIADIRIRRAEILDANAKEGDERREEEEEEMVEKEEEEEDEEDEDEDEEKEVCSFSVTRRVRANEKEVVKKEEKEDEEEEEEVEEEEEGASVAGEDEG
ncbi:hypothetical protein HZH68_002395 [Vespula germanica]|uniref:Uncharacterized protein n=1 Tax=Vespula germanica TaxID=30212 RepID=A0A834U0A3_VESGE|nr:hypothetical protein HZH68_002395 [Vespula germanica]